MTLKEFLEVYNYASYDISEIAGLAMEITDLSTLSEAAIYFSDSKEILENELRKAGFEFG